jgi:catechol 2,3-dioxygenase-like lactoylglutathione lyase family enzyme
MTRSLTGILENVSNVNVSRRQMLTLAAGLIAVPGSIFAQDTAAGRGRGQARDVTPLVPPFEPTGWKTVWLDHLNYQCADYKKAAAFYASLMGWKIRSDDGKQAVLDTSENSGGIIIRGGLNRTPAPALTDSALGLDRSQIHAIYDGFAWGIEPWDENKVKAELTKRGLNPIADHRGNDYRSFRIKDPDGFDLAITNGTKALRRKTPANGKLPATAPFEPTGWNTLYLDHISFESPDYRRSAAFYQALLGWEMRPGNGSVSAQIGSVAGALIRGNAAVRAATPRGSSAPPAPSPEGGPAVIGHICWGIENWETERVRTELKKRGLGYILKEAPREPYPDMTGSLQSFHVPDAMGWDLQIGNKTAPDRS